MTFRNPCRAFHALVEESAYGLLDGPEHAPARARLEAHLGGCADCRDRWEVERSLTESLEASARVRVSVSVEERVLAAVRAESARRTAPARLSGPQKAALGAAAATAAGEIVLWAAVVLVALRAPMPSGLSSLLAAIPEMFRPVLTVTSGAADVARALAGAASTVAHGLLLLLPSPELVAAAFVSLVSLLTVIAVRRDLHRSPAAARGLR
jgi:hypothetical protein